MVENFAGIGGTLGVIPNTAINKQTKVLTHLLPLVADGNSSPLHDSPPQNLGTQEDSDLRSRTTGSGFPMVEAD